MALSFDITTKQLKLPFDNYVDDNLVLSLGDWKMWACFANGQWILFDLAGEGKILNRGLISKNDINKHAHILQYPITFDGKTIIFASAPDEKVVELNPFTGEFLVGWDVLFPTIECLPINERDKVTNFMEPVNQFQALGLEESQTFVLVEQKGDKKLVTAARRGEPYFQAALQTESRNYILGKGNNKNKIILAHDNPEKKLTFSIWDLSDVNAGFVNYNIDCDIQGVLLSVSGWGDNEVMFLGNVDGVETPTLHFVNTQERKVTGQESIYADKPSETIATQPIHIDQKKKKVLFIENGPPDVISLFDVEKKRPYCSIKQQALDSEGNNTEFACSNDGKFILEYCCPYDWNKGVSDEREGVMHVRVLRVIQKQKVLLHLMKNHTTKEGQPIDLIHYYGNPYVAAQVLEMLGEKKTKI